MKTKFTQIYNNLAWGSTETISGSGSRVLSTIKIREVLQNFINKFQKAKPLVVCDLGCGDANWIKEINFKDSHYIGIDIVPEIIYNNLQNYSDLDMSFRVADICTDALPMSDIMICKDIFTHLPLQECIKIINNVIKSKSKYLITYSSPDVNENIEGILGGWRKLNLMIEPFNFPQPLELIKEIRADKYFAIWDIKDLHIIGTNNKTLFADIINIYSDNSTQDSDRYKLKNVIEGIGKGFDSEAPFGSISRKEWCTTKIDKKFNHYFEGKPEPIEINIKFQKNELIDSVAIWSYRTVFGNSIHRFTLEFSKDSNSFSLPLEFYATETNPYDIELFNFNTIDTKYIKMKIYSNHNEVGIGGDRVGFQEIAFGRDYNKIKKMIDDDISNECKFDFIRPLLQTNLNDYQYFILNISSEFSLDKLWKPNMKYNDYLKLRGLGGRGTQLRRINLSKWGDKIYMYHFLKENSIKGMPILLFTNRPNDDFIDKVKRLYEKGMKSFVIKMSHLGDSNGIFRIKNGLYITPNEIKRKTSQYGKEVDFKDLSKQIQNHWYNKQYYEDWVSNMIPPGVILEELLDDPTELKYSVIFGKVVGFFIEKRGLPSFDANGKALKNRDEVLPFWWKDALIEAEKVASLIKADHLRIDFYYNKGEVILSEVNWNGGERPENYPEIAKQLNYGYELRAKYLAKEV